MATLAELQAELAPFKGTLVIGDFDNIVLLKDVIDGEDDYYWVYYGWMRDKKLKYHSTCVGGWVGLKGVVPDDQYKRLVNIWNLNTTEENYAI